MVEELDEKKLYTTSELAAVFGVVKTNALERMRQLGIEPVAPHKMGPGGHEALWDYAAYCAAKKRHDEEAAAQRILLMQRHVNKLTEEEQGFVVVKNIEALQNRHDAEAMKAKAFAAASMIQSLMGDVEFYKNEYEDLETKLTNERALRAAIQHEAVVRDTAWRAEAHDLICDIESRDNRGAVSFRARVKEEEIAVAKAVDERCAQASQTAVMLS